MWREVIKEGIVCAKVVKGEGREMLLRRGVVCERVGREFL